ncbi:5'-Nucleotidase domain-containing protein [Caldalkalibacillus thermarum TA2.A1]|uniref:5'-Nucleotidase domain-containing protein n=1 Tax=Caldalkalibacillus thermarum (strain TA2.A1) TaxID=986075 RepID=F5L6G9_CALTT|nr:5'-nucleotidase C-terminal domain-containing protein [Caldalkalibacillus thermarum]EGL83079.1 5'-Nucleotidase domain-containing protein [Caldalkalibacillus thermarum TA2.A1]QZT34914.1 5'-nucleotidase C-terminal domain-containing protein [Caldalkalibacillus thermarum TA2.A1]
MMVVSLFFSWGMPQHVLAEEQETYNLKILHTNDIHSAYQDFGKLAAYVQQERESEAYDEVLYLDAGDIFSGDPVIDLQEGEPLIELFNVVGLDAMTIGNHEFDYGQEAFARNMANSHFPWLSANMRVVDPGIPIRQPEPYHIFDLGDLTVGVLGLTEAPPSTASAGVVGLEFDPYVETVESYAYLRDEVDILIALTHIGYGEDRRLAEAVDFFDVIIGGHSHTALQQPVVVNGTPIAQAGSNLNYIGNLILEIDRETKEVVRVEGYLQDVSQLTEIDETVQAMVDRYTEEMEELLGKVIGYTNTGLSREGRDRGDAPLGNFWTDAMRYAVGSDIALTNNGGIRDSIAPGEITVRDIYRVEPFQNEMMEYEMTGQAIKDVICFSYERRNQIDLQTSGLAYTIITDPMGNLLDVELYMDGEPLDLDRTYRVAVNDYIGTGGSGYEFRGAVRQPSAGYLTNAMISYAEYLMATQGSIDYTSEGRIKIKVDDSAPVPGEEIGYTEYGLSDRNKTKMDASLGNLYADAVRAISQADIALLNNSSVTGEIPPGPITKEIIESLDRFGNEIVVVKAKGERIRDMILSQSNYHNGVDLQVSGLTYTLIEGEGTPRFKDIKLSLADGSAFDPDAEYIVAYNDYMHSRSFYNVGSEVIGQYGKVWEAVVEYVKSVDGPIDYEEGLRITIKQEHEPVPPTLADLRETVEKADMHHGIKTAILKRIDPIERHVERAQAYWDAGEREKAGKEEEQAYYKLDGLAAFIADRDKKQIPPEVQQELLDMIAAMMDHQSLLD